MAILNVSDVLSIRPLTVLPRLTSQTACAYQVSRATLQSVKTVQELDLNNFADIPTYIGKTLNHFMNTLLEFSLENNLDILDRNR